uniref:Uncharacterized protein n=1 Tax=Panagrolaimus sp. PS1159 TaxID=55785 RepID=A0AC35GS93_9BILA
MLLLKIFLIIITIICFVKGFQPPWMFMGRPLTGFRQDGIIDSINATESQPFNQFLDHFGKNGTKWEQRYWKNDKFAEDEKGLHFLILGGEYEASSFDILYEKYPHVKYAKECNATLWLLEHRFYGKSQPLK